MRALVLALLLLTGAAQAETVRLASGEHDGFTRLVLQLAEPTPWQLGRTTDGYALRLGREGVRFDLTQVFRAIPRSRLAAIWADPATGELRLGIACACHAIPFEFRDDVIVIDLKDGAPPAGSSFELALDGGSLPRLAAREQRRPRARPADFVPVSFNWTTRRAEPAPVLLAEPAPDLAGMRDALLWQLSRGASQGLVMLALPGTGLPADAPAPAPGGRVATGLGPRVQTLVVTDPQPGLTPKGATCIEDARLDLPSWGDTRPFAEQIAEARSALVGEFDRPDTEAIGRLVRLQLYFGFGLDARASLTALAADLPDAPLWSTMALILDGEPVPPGNPFADQLNCPTASALWAALAPDELRPSDHPDSAAVLRSFSALPLPLRRHLGPALAERFLAIDDASSASAVRDAMLRAPGDPGPAARLADARLDLASGRVEQAALEIEKVTGEAGPMLPQAMIDLVEARLAQGTPVDLATIEALASLASEQAGGPLGPALRRAEGLARASAGDFRAGFAVSAATDPGFDAELWPLLARSGPDSALLAEAVLDPAEVPVTDRQTRQQIARRLVGLGFAEAALAWLPVPDGEEEVLLAARAELLREDARGALRRLAGLSGEEANRLRAAAQLQLGDAELAAQSLAAAGDSAGAERALLRARDWAAVADTATDPALAAAAALAEAGSEPLVDLPANADDPVSVPSRPAPLARGRALIADSAEARAALLAMLSAVPDPRP